MPTLEANTFDVTTDGVAEQSQFASPGYDVIEDKKRRKPPTATTRSEDKVLDQSGRRKVSSTARDIRRNVSIAAWMIRKHLDFVTQFEFHARSGDDGLNAELERLVRKIWSRPSQAHSAGRYRLSKLLRITEGCATVDGDCGLLKLRNGRLQGIEGDRIRQPQGMSTVSQELDGDRWIHGVKVNRAGRHLAYAIHRRVNGGSAFEFERDVRGSRLELHGFYDRFDQVRGVSPIVAALNPLRDVYENFDYALIRSKVQQLFALAITRNSEELTGETYTGEDTDDDGQDERYDVDFGRGPVKLELDPGDDAKFLESSQPSSEFQAFTNLVVAVALKALDIPFNFYDESHTNFFGSRAAWLLYDRSARDKRNDVAELLRRLTVWRLSLFIQDRELTLPSGMSLGELDFEWVPVGMPWWDPAKEIKGDLMAIGAALDTPQRITKERGRGDWFENIDEIKKALEYAESQGVPVNFDPGPPEPVVLSGTGGNEGAN